MNRISTALAALSLLFFSGGCDTNLEQEYEPYYVVEGYLFGNETLQPVRLSTTAPLGQVWRFSDQAVTGATVTVSLMRTNETEEVEQTFAYTMLEPGVYQPESNITHRVIPARRYRLDITGLNKPDIKSTAIKAYTIIPDSVHVARIGYESQLNRPPYVPGSVLDITYQQEDQLLIDLNIGRLTDGRNQNFYVFTIIAEDTARSNLTPFYAAVLENEPLDEVYFNDSGIINQANYKTNPDNTVSIQFPWIGIAFYGKNTLVANSIDRNYYDFRRSQQVQLGGGTISPGEINNPLYRIEGALGVLGSMSRAAFDVDVKKISFF